MARDRKGAWRAAGASTIVREVNVRTLAAVADADFFFHLSVSLFFFLWLGAFQSAVAVEKLNGRRWNDGSIDYCVCVWFRVVTDAICHGYGMNLTNPINLNRCAKWGLNG